MQSKEPPSVLARSLAIAIGVHGPSPYTWLQLACIASLFSSSFGCAANSVAKNTFGAPRCNIVTVAHGAIGRDYRIYNTSSTALSISSDPSEKSKKVRGYEHPPLPLAYPLFWLSTLSRVIFTYTFILHVPFVLFSIRPGPRELLQYNNTKKLFNSVTLHTAPYCIWLFTCNLQYK